MNVGLFRNCTEKENFMNTSFMTINTFAGKNEYKQ